MTSKKSFSNLIIGSIRNNIWSIACSFVILFLTMPIYGALTVSVLKNRIIERSITASRLTDYYTKGVLGESNSLLQFAVIFLAVIIAFNSFSYLFSKQKVDLYHSLPIKRETLFFANIVAGIITFVVPYLFNMIILIIISKANSVLTIYGCFVALVTFLINLLGFICMYSVTVLSILLTGKIIVAIMGTIAFFSYGPLLWLLSRSLCRLFFRTFYEYMESSTDLLSSTSAIVSYLNLTDGMDSYSHILSLDIFKIAAYIIATAILIVLNIYIYKQKASEATGNSIAFRKIIPVISVCILIPACLFGGIMFDSFATNGKPGIHFGWFIFGCAFTIIIIHFILQAIFYGDFKAMFKDFAYPLTAAIVSAIVTVILAFDLIHYDNLIISDGRYESIALSTFNLSGNQEYFDFDGQTDYYGNSNTWILDEKYHFDNMKLTDETLIDDFLKAAISNKECILDNDKDYNYYCNFTVKLNRKNGNSIYRCYRIPTEENRELLERLYSNEEYKRGVFSIFNIDEDKLSGFAYSNPVGEIAKIDDAAIKNIVEAYKDELLNQSGKELEDIVPIGFIYKKHTVNNDYYTSDYQLYKCYIYPSFTKTISLLEDAGIDLYKYTDLDNIQKIIVTNYDYDDTYARSESYSSELKSMEYTDSSSIKSIYENCYSMYMSDANGALFSRDSAGVDIYFDDMPDRGGYSIVYSFKKDALPDFVKKDIGK